MLDLFQLMKNAQDGAAIANFARQFGVTEEMTEQAMRAFMPAFAAALQRQAADPIGSSALFQTMMSRPFASYFEDAGKMFSPTGLADSHKLADNLFPPKGMLTEITNQVAAMTGLGIDVVQNMFPVFASMMMGGLAKNMTAGPFSDAMQTFLKGYQPEQKASDPMELMQAMAQNNPFLEAYNSFFSAFRQPDQPEEKPQEDATAGQFKFFDDMITLGQNIQAEQIRGFNEIMAKFQKDQKDG